MELRQYKGPFTSGQRITVSPQTGYTYVHIGIQIPKVQPLTVPNTSVNSEEIQYRPSRPNVQISINNKTYQVNECGILEFDGLAEIEWNIQFLQAMPAETIIDIVRS